MALYHNTMQKYSCSAPSETLIDVSDESQSGELLINELVHEDDMQITDLQWSKDRTYFITASKDKTAKVRQRTTQSKLLALISQFLDLLRSRPFHSQNLYL